MKEKVITGLSGGVDSSVAAFLLRERGYDVVGVTVLTGQNGEETEDARRVAKELGIPFLTVEFEAEFQRCVKDYFVEEYLRGRTPNPCIACNRFVKWEALLSCCAKEGAAYVATGHYARVLRLNNGRYTIAKPVTEEKDQSYALYRLTQEQLARTILPLGEYTKEEIRSIAEKNGISVAHKPDSQEICFIPDDDYAGYIDRAAKARVPGPGNFVTAHGEVLGEHKGITHYTIGQRRGLELPMGHRVFVTTIRPDENEVVVGENEELMTRTVRCDSVRYMAIEDLASPRRVQARIRYHHRGGDCVIEKTADGKVLCTFEQPVRAATPGQSAVFYEDGYILGGGTIIGT